jgi:hypothetical protein
MCHFKPDNYLLLSSSLATTTLTLRTKGSLEQRRFLKTHSEASPANISLTSPPKMQTKETFDPRESKVEVPIQLQLRQTRY